MLPAGANIKMGIGTTGPTTKLHLGGTAPLDSIIRQDSTVSGTNWEIGERAAGKWQIWQDDGDTVVTTFMSTGNVGIGTDSPSYKLEVAGDLSLNSGSQATGTTELDSLLFRKAHPSIATSYYTQGIIKGVTYGGYAGGMNFYYNRSNNDGSGNYTNTQALWLNEYGNFCIGENSSSYKLRVKGGTIAYNSVSNGAYITAGTSSSNHALYVEGEGSGGEWLAVRGDGEIRLNASNGHTYAAQGIRFGANASANNLDDYEEGTWTPEASTSNSDTTTSYTTQLVLTLK